MKALLADDEPKLLEHLFNTLQMHWPELEIIGKACNGQEALQLIQQEKPDIAFLDIRMPGISGIEVAGKVADQCQIVFITAFDEYAIEAFETNAVDYLLKPYSVERIKKTIERLKNSQPSINSGQLSQLLQNLQNAQQPTNNKLTWVKASIGDDTFLIHIDDVLMFESDAKYTSVITKDNNYPIRTTLNELESQLDTDKFWRIHRGVIVNIKFVAKVKRQLDGRYLLSLQTIDKELTVSRSYAHKFKQM